MRRTVALVEHAPHAQPLLVMLASAIRRRGIDAIMVPSNAVPDVDAVVAWGWRRAAPLVQRFGADRVLVMERGYMTDAAGRDRMTWTSLAWGGLNGYGRFHTPDDGGERWRRYYAGCLAQRRAKGSFVVLMGQVPGDASITGLDMHAWYRKACVRLQEMFDRPVVFRPHPLHRGPGWNVDVPVTDRPLRDCLEMAAVVAGYNSNSLVDAAMAGIPVVACDRGAMAWPIADYHGLERTAPAIPDPEAWAARMAWTQWLPEEIANGSAWEAVVQARNAEPFHLIPLRKAA